MPLPTSSVGSQLKNRYSISRPRKKLTQSSSVGTARPAARIARKLPGLGLAARASAPRASALPDIPAALRTRSNAGDSRSFRSMIGAMIRGATPPAMNIHRQCDGAIDMLIRLATAPPNGAPLYIRATLALRRPAALHSLTSAMRFGSAPPRPSPVSRRAPQRDRMSQASGFSSEATPNMAIEATSTCLRPIESASRPPASAPMNNPNVLALKKVPSWSGLGLNSGPMPPAATPAACRSMPSQKAASRQQTIVAKRRSWLTDSWPGLFDLDILDVAAIGTEPFPLHGAVDRHGLGAM